MIVEYNINQLLKRIELLEECVQELLSKSANPSLLYNFIEERDQIALRFTKEEVVNDLLKSLDLENLKYYHSHEIEMDDDICSILIYCKGKKIFSDYEEQKRVRNIISEVFDVNYCWPMVYFRKPKSGKSK